MSHRYAVVAALTLAVVLGPLGVGSSRAAANPLARAASAPLTQASTYLEGIDVSHWNGTINWPQVAGAGKTFAIIKATEGETFLDSMYATNHSGARAAGLRATAYHFAQPGLPTSEATIQADWFVQNAALLPGDLIPVLDLEVSGGLSTTDLQAWVLAWLTEVNAKLGVKAMIYTNPSFWQPYMGGTTMFADQGYTLLWIAHWFVSSPTTPANNWDGHGWTFWQYDDCGTVAGISGCVDLDRYHGTDFTPVTFGTMFVPLTPVRLLDTRAGNGLSGAFFSHVARTFGVAGRGGGPAKAVAVTGNLTVTAQTASGYVYLGPGATNNPTSSTLNFPLRDDRANGVTVALGAGGTLSATYVAATAGPTTQVIFDVTGYFVPDPSGATYVPLAPARLLDTRVGNGLSGAFSSHVARTVQVTGRGGVPANAVAVTGNLTVTAQTAGGYLFLGPGATNNPTSSTLNFPVRDDRANGVTVALGAGGTLSATYVAATAGPTAQVIFDVTGYFVPDTSGATYVPLTPAGHPE